MAFYLRPHDGSLAVGPFTTSDEAVTFYHANMDRSGCDVVEMTDPSLWPVDGNGLVYRYEYEEAGVNP